MSKKSQTEIFNVDYDLYDAENGLSERGLLAAILVNAMHDLKQEGFTGRQAKDFFLSLEDDYIFSFRGICSYLNIDPSYVLQAVGLRG